MFKIFDNENLGQVHEVQHSRHLIGNPNSINVILGVAASETSTFHTFDVENLDRSHRV